MKLSARAERFVAEYLIDLNATQAAIRADYSPKNADVVGPRLLGKVGIAAAISLAARPKLERLEFDADRVLQGAARVAFFDLRKLFDEQGRLRPLHQLDEPTASAIASFEVHTRYSRTMVRLWRR
jgi:phage terminase small subunit